MRGSFRIYMFVSSLTLIMDMLILSNNIVTKSFTHMVPMDRRSSTSMTTWRFITSHFETLLQKCHPVFPIEAIAHYQQPLLMHKLFKLVQWMKGNYELLNSPMRSFLELTLPTTYQFLEETKLGGQFWNWLLKRLFLVPCCFYW